MRVSKKTEYAIHSVLYVAMSEDDSVLLDELATQGFISRDYLAKVMRLLTKVGILSSSVGVSGGYVLGRPPSEITLKDIIIACEGEPTFWCAHEERECDAYPECGILTPFRGAFDKMLDELQKTTIEDLTHKASVSTYKLKWLKK